MAQQPYIKHIPDFPVQPVNRETRVGRPVPEGIYNANWPLSCLFAEDIRVTPSKIFRPLFFSSQNDKPTHHTIYQSNINEVNVQYGNTARYTNIHASRSSLSALALESQSQSVVLTYPLIEVVTDIVPIWSSKQLVNVRQSLFLNHAHSDH